MVTLNSTVWNEIRNVLTNQQETEILEAQIESRCGSFRYAAETFLKKIPSYKLDTVESIDGGLDAKQEELIKEALKVYSWGLAQKGKSAVMNFTGVKPFATAKAEIRMEANLSDYLTSSDPATQLILRMTNVYLTLQADLRYKAIENGEEWEFIEGRIEQGRGITGMIHFMYLPK